jgi:nicotinamidase-related amidase
VAEQIRCQKQLAPVNAVGVAPFDRCMPEKAPRTQARRMYNFPMATAPVDTAPYSEAARRLLRPEDCALAVIDIQEKLLPPIFEKERLVRTAQLLVRLADILSLPVLVSTQYQKGLGQTVEEISSLLPATRTVDKLEFGCFGNSEYCSTVGSLADRNTLLLCGMESHICVTQTALGALNQGLNVHVAADAVSSRTELNWKLGLNRMQAAGAVLSSTEMIIYELLGKSGTPAFKEMLKHLK